MSRRLGTAGEARAIAAAIAAAAAITVLDGFDALSLSLMAPKISADLHIPTAALGMIFASTLGGMILGALAGGVLADKLGRLRILLVTLALFGLAALVLPLASTTAEVLGDRLLAGVGLGAAAPIAVGLLSRSSGKPPSQFVIAVVWAGIGVGGVLAAAFNYLVVTDHGWRSMFIAGGLLPIPAAALAYAVWRDRGGESQPSAPAARPRFTSLFAPGVAWRTIATALMFFFGYVTTSIIASWLPTILSHRHATPLMISAAFGGLNIGGFVSTILLGLLSVRTKSAWTLAGAWAVTGLCGLAAALPALGNLPVALIAAAAAVLGAGSQALSVAFASQLHRNQGLESTSVGFMTGMGRIGQFSVLSLSGVLIGLGLPETGLFAFAGAAACLAAVFALLIGGPRPSPMSP